MKAVHLEKVTNVTLPWAGWPHVMLIRVGGRGHDGRGGSMVHLSRLNSVEHWWVGQTGGR